MRLPIAMARCSEAGARSANEDAVGCGEEPGGRWHAVLSDGAGGHAGGAEASRRVIDCLGRALAAPQVPFEPRVLTEAIERAHAELCATAPAGSASRSGAARRMHATVVALWGDATSGSLLWSHVGDSRLYRVRDGTCWQLTRDDSVIQSMVDAGYLSADEAQRHPQRSQLLAALGMSAELQPHTILRAERARDGDAYLLCSDGWWESLAPAGIADRLRRSTSPMGWLQAMRRDIESAQVAGQDNLSAVAVWIGDPAATVLLPFDDTVP